MDELQITVETNNASIVCVTETWFKEYMDIHSLALEGFCLERKDRINGRGGGVACYIRNAINYKRLVDMEDTELEVMWIKIMPKKMPRKFTCILLACIYFTQQTVFSQMRDHIITCVDTVLRSHPECGVIITGDFNQLHDNFLRTHYRFVQVVVVVTRGLATLDKLTLVVCMRVSPDTYSAMLKYRDYDVTPHIILILSLTLTQNARGVGEGLRGVLWRWVLVGVVGVRSRWVGGGDP